MPRPRETRLILVDDDNFSARAVVKQLSGNPGTSLHHVGSVSQAIDHLGSHHVDAVLLNLATVRAGGDDPAGLQAIRRLRRAAPRTGLILLADVAHKTAAMMARPKVTDIVITGRSDLSPLTRAVRYAAEHSRLGGELDQVRRELNVACGQLSFRMTRDEVSGTLNRRGLHKALLEEVGAGTPIVALLVRIDGLEGINDALGHAVGEIVLADVGRRLISAARPGDQIGRVAGDTFLALLPATTDGEGLAVGERIRMALTRSPLTVSRGTVKLGARVAAVRVTDEVNIDTLIAHCRANLDHQNLGSQQTPNRELDPIVEVLRRGDSFRAVMQPIIRLSDEQPVGWEILSRLSADVFGMPDDFFRLSLETNLLTPVDHHCLRTCAAVAKHLPDGARCHLNLFPSTLINIPIDHLLAALPHKPRGTFCIEISEQQILGDPTYLAGPVAALKKAGHHVAIDDVGFGRSCLENLVHLEPDVIKVDRRCVGDISRRPELRRSFSRFLTMAEALGAEVVAEGIENVPDLEALRDLGASYGQGYLWGRPGVSLRGALAEC